MRFLVAFLFAIVAVANAQHGGYEHKHLEEYVDYQAHPHYNYNYGVHDGHTHDIKDQHETRDGHKTKGHYSLLQPDGRKRIVEYEADKHGVHYNVKYEGHAIHEQGHTSGGGHGHSVSNQYHQGVTNFHGASHHGGGGQGGQGGHGGHGGEGHGYVAVSLGHGGSGGGQGGQGGYGHGGSGGGGGHGQATSYATHITHGHGHGGHY